MCGRNGVRSDDRRRPPAFGLAGAFALGALAMGAVAIGALGLRLIFTAPNVGL